ncbi:uncharacterized protein [Anabrus simplex]|uniref:uncharacterized protein n=1 Tax=Anabrus simplex TaxID=316456 RepID=UPI0035A2A805
MVEVYWQVAGGHPEAISQCRNEFHFSEDDTSRIFEKGATTRDEKCFLGCFFSTLGVIVDGKYSLSGAEAHVDKDFANDPDKAKKIHAVNAKCAEEVTTTDKCETGELLRACYHKNLGE